MKGTPVASALALFAALLVAFQVPFAPPSATASEPGLVQVGTLDAETIGSRFGLAGEPKGPTRMIVDPVRRVGLTAGPGADAPGEFVASYDLDHRVIIASRQVPNWGLPLFDRSGPAVWGLDTRRSRMYARGEQAIPCTTGDAFENSTGIDVPEGFWAFDYGSEPGALVERRVSIPCSLGLQPYASGAVAYDASADLLYGVGRPTSDGVVRGLDPLLGTQDNMGSGLLVRQMAIGADGLELDWELDLRQYGCGRRDSQFVYRLPGEVLSYCWDARAFFHQTGLQGYVVRIPLRNGPNGRPVPATLGGADPLLDPESGLMLNADVRRIPALPGPVEPLVDPGSQRLLLVTSGLPNGNAVWVFDPPTERFVGVITGGVSDEPVGNNSVGLDSTTGRVYVLTAAGILVADTRASPLPTGTLVPVLANEDRKDYFASTGAIAVLPGAPECGGCTRLYVGLTGRTNYVVLEDRLPHPIESAEADPDALTTQVPEVPGRTQASSTGAAIASGVHLVVAGGLTRPVNSLDPFCFAPLESLRGENVNIEQERAVLGSCAADVLVAPGHREFFAADARVEASTEAGVSARSHGFRAAVEDRATDRDVRSLGRCHLNTIEGSGDSVGRFFESQDSSSSTTTTVSPTESPPHHEACSSVHEAVVKQGGPDLRSGTQGSDGRGSPIAGAVCNEFGLGSSSASAPPSALSEAGVHCGAGEARSQAFGRLGPVVLPSPQGAPALSVLEVASTVDSRNDATGRVTVATSVVRGVRIGPLAIGEVRSSAVSSAHGRAGTARTQLSREWCQVELADEILVEGCVSWDPADPRASELLRLINGSLGRAQISVPPAERQATLGGYQSVLTKDPDVRGADQAVNDDESHTVSALQVVVYNDGAEGRNRLVVQFAGVHAEARYGITLLPDFDVPTFDFSVEVSGGVVERVTPGRPGQPGRPDEFETLVLGRRLAAERPAPDEVLLEQVDRSPFGIVRSALAWLLNNPREAALLFAIWLVLATPVYLAMRRRSYSWAVAVEEEF